MWRVLALCALASIAFPQPSDSVLTFEVASIKPSGPNSIRGSDGGPGSRDPERYIFGKARLGDLIFLAYGLRFEGQISGPGWITDENSAYDLAVKMPKGTTKAKFQIMLRNLLSERFKLAVHIQPKEFPVYDLVIAKSGPKLKESGSAPEDDRHIDGFPDLPPGQPAMANTFGTGAMAHLRTRQQTMARFTLFVSNHEDRQVIDKTGLTAQYDFMLAYTFGGPASSPGDTSAPFLREALEEQLGLKLVDSKAIFDVIIVDHAERTPTEN